MSGTPRTKGQDVRPWSQVASLFTLRHGTPMTAEEAKWLHRKVLAKLRTALEHSDTPQPEPAPIHSSGRRRRQPLRAT